MKGSVRIIGIITAAVTFTASMPAAFAADADYESLILEVKNRVDVPEEYTEFENTGRYDYGDTTVYSFTWRTADDEESVSVQAKGDGTVMSYWASGNERNRYDSLTMDETAAKDAAEIFLSKAVPELNGIAKLERQTGYSYGGITYSINAEYYGLEFYREIGEITVDRDYNVYSMNVEPPEVKAPEHDVKYIGAEDGIAAYRDKIGVETVYRTYRGEDKRLMTYPVYMSIDDKAIDAVTGEVIDIGRSYRAYAANMGAAAEDSMASGSGAGYRELNESEIAELETLGGLIGEDEAIGIINERLGISVEPTYKSLYSDADGRYFYTFSAKDNSFEVDAQNGDIVMMSIDGSNDVLDGYNFDDAESARQLINTIAPVSGAEYVYDNSDDTSYQYDSDTNIKSSQFIFEVNGIKVEGAYAYANKRERDGNVWYSTGVTATEPYKAAEYADPAGFIDRNETFYGSDPCVSLKYAERWNEETERNEPVAVYMSEPFIVSALTGKEVDHLGEDISAITYSDAEGHWSQYAAEKLAGADIGYRGGMLRPDEAVTAADAKELIESAFGRDITDEYGDGMITRLDAAKIIIKCKGLEKLAEMDIYEQPYSDITENYGITAILKGYGVIDGSADKFRPSDTLTRAELLQMVYNTLVNFNR